jgi:GNAT superfamily N-acetyltransferase
MNPVNITTVKSKKELMQFIRFQWKIYKNDQYWVPPLIMDRKKLLNREKNPFFKHAEMEMFLAERDGELVGRIAAIKNDLHNSTHNDKVGFFGFFECINDQEVANALFDKAKEWLKLKGMNAMRGPANPSSNDEYGMLLEGFDDSPRLLMPYNPSWYLTLCENYGFKKAKDLYAYKIEQEKLVKQEKLKRVAQIAKDRSKINIRELNLKDFNNELQKVKEVYNKAWAPNWGFVPLTEEEMDAVAKDMKPLADPSIILFGEIDGKTVGFALVLPDYNKIFKKMNGRLFPFGFIRLLTENKKITWARILILGVIPEYQKKGLDAVFYWEIVNRAEKRGIIFGEASWVLEDNEMMKRGAEVMGGTLYKQYRIFEIEI